VSEAWRLFDETVDFWESWLGQSTYAGRWREELNRSAITLKLNWDYRYTWIRDASFSVYALLGMGFRDEAAALGRWLRDRVDESAGADGGGPLKIMYRVDGSSDLTEEVLDHWEGYRGSAPVRVRERCHGPASA
jgi:GH15 family glucan-1,4-alpha-glucosidase